jgi:hypothetical protein
MPEGGRLMKMRLLKKPGQGMAFSYPALLVLPRHLTTQVDVTGTRFVHTEVNHARKSTVKPV